MAWVSPKLDWDTNPINPTEVDLNRIEGNIDFLKTDIETKKGAIVDALNEVGITATITDTHAQLASKITTAEKTGITIVPSTVNQAIPKGIYDTGGGVVAGDADLVASKIKYASSIFGVTGAFAHNITYFQSRTYEPSSHYVSETLESATIESVNTSSSIVLTRILGHKTMDVSSASSAGEREFRIGDCYLSSPTTVSFYHYGVAGRIGIEVISFDPATVKSLQTGVVSVTSVTDVNVTISAVVDITKCLVFFAGGQKIRIHDTDKATSNSIWGALTSTTNLRIYNTIYSTYYYGITGRWYVVEFY
jgi:hypothetical protein